MKFSWPLHGEGTFKIEKVRVNVKSGQVWWNYSLSSLEERTTLWILFVKVKSFNPWVSHQYRWSLSVILKYFCVEYGKVTPCYYYNVWLDVLCHIISWRAAILFINCQKSSGWQYLISNSSRCPLIVFTAISTADTVSLTLVWSGLFDRMECLNLWKESKCNDITNI